MVVDTGAGPSLTTAEHLVDSWRQTLADVTSIRHQVRPADGRGCLAGRWWMPLAVSRGQGGVPDAASSCVEVTPLVDDDAVLPHSNIRQVGSYIITMQVRARGSIG